MTEVTGNFTIRRYWLKPSTPADVLATLNWKRGIYQHKEMPYVSISYYGESDRDITMMELRYTDWIETRQEIHYSVSGDDGL